MINDSRLTIGGELNAIKGNAPTIAAGRRPQSLIINH
jgi:hypothetical protein